jgi:hypothetical protein
MGDHHVSIEDGQRTRVTSTEFSPASRLLRRRAAMLNRGLRGSLRRDGLPKASLSRLRSPSQATFWPFCAVVCVSDATRLQRLQGSW